MVIRAFREDAKSYKPRGRAHCSLEVHTLKIFLLGESKYNKGTYVHMKYSQWTRYPLPTVFCIFEGRKHENIFTYPLSEGARSRLLSWAAFAFLFIFMDLWSF